MKAISEKLEALKTSMSSSITGAPATYTVPMGPIRTAVYNAACLTNSTPQSTFDTMFRRAQAAEKLIEPTVAMLEDDVAKQNALTAASLRILLRQGLDGYRCINDTNSMLAAMTSDLGRRLEESKKTCLIKTNAAAVDSPAVDAPTYRPDESTPFGGVSVDFEAVERERQELLQLLGR